MRGEYAGHRCTHPGCSRELESSGLCGAHYRVEVQAEIIAAWSPLIDRLEAKLAEVERQRDLALEGEREKACRVAEVEAALKEILLLNGMDFGADTAAEVMSEARAIARAALSSPPPHDGGDDRLREVLLAVLDTHDAWDEAEAEKFSHESMARRRVRCEAFYGAKKEARSALSSTRGGGEP